ncbi:hypothetical protein LptCag_1117 [Leptospirillum ferriphilum]|uniref:Uncharacterized protein n=1 Tax=Leptospirillum ferriphilum TaxID=178606 RepID=A0A094X725_9BACT|nr:hypothetical protein LptCag_1117 [Leptospirillum ferriphilum]
MTAQTTGFPQREQRRISEQIKNKKERKEKGSGIRSAGAGRLAHDKKTRETIPAPSRDLS